jgi:hypothetical protein
MNVHTTALVALLLLAGAGSGVQAETLSQCGMTRSRHGNKIPAIAIDGRSTLKEARP